MVISMIKNISNNLFNYATSELSQDAFICYLCSFAIKGNDNNKVLYNCAIEFINLMLPDNNKLKMGEYLDTDENYQPIMQQYNNIDVLICAKGFKIIIEDKTFTGLHDDQINKYKKSLLDQGVSADKICTVYYKIIEQSNTENVDFEFNRNKLLDLFNTYYSDANDKIFTDYVDYLKKIDNSVNDYNKSIVEWETNQYIGFFNFLKSERLIDDGYWQAGWGYVPNQTGGFMGMWWSPKSINNLYNSCKGELYIQIEANRIVLKIYNDDLNKEMSEDEQEQIINARYRFKNELDAFIKDEKYDVKRMGCIKI